jgi:hypothetical protein
MVGLAVIDNIINNDGVIVVASGNLRVCPATQITHGNVSD